MFAHTAVVIGTKHNYFVVHDTDVGYKNYAMKYDFWIENYKIGPIIATELILLKSQFQCHGRLINIYSSKEKIVRHQKIGFWSKNNSGLGYGQIHK